MLLFRGASPAAAEAFAKSDPYVRAGIVTNWRIREWTTVVGNDATVRGGGLAGNPMSLRNVLIANNTGGNGNCDVAQIDRGGNLQFPAGACGVRVATRHTMRPKKRA